MRVEDVNGIVNSVEPGQSAQALVADRSGSALFAQIGLSQYLGFLRLRLYT